METKPTQRELMDKVGISQPYASLILAGKRQPPKPLAVHIYRVTGWRHEVLADIAETDLAIIERIDPWQPQARAA